MAWICNDTRLCITQRQVCDGEAQCIDKSDESTERCYFEWKCEEGMMNCTDIEPQNITEAVYRCVEICDGIAQCYNGADEENCTEHTCPIGFGKCADNTKCITDAQVSYIHYNL